MLSKTTFIMAAALLAVAGCNSGAARYADYPIEPVNLTQVTLCDSFWLPKIRTVQHATIRYAFAKCEAEGRLDNFATAGRVLRGDTAGARVRGKMPFDDTDIYKTIEGAAYSLSSVPDAALDRYVDSVIAVVAQGQEPDGYLCTWRTIAPANPPAAWVHTNGQRWNGLSMSHELYNCGHLFEAAAAHFRATGKRNFLDIALRNADLLVNVFGDTANHEVPGHEIVETGLIQLYQISGNDSYLKLAKKFMDERGNSRHTNNSGAYSQDHLPVVQQNEAVGHAVRAVYLYAGMTDAAAILSDSAYRAAVEAIWQNMVGKKMYITGGLGARHQGESFGRSYELPNRTAYAETCAAIGGVYWAERMFRLTGSADYANIMERMLYNGLISGISLGGTEFFYPNPLEADGAYKFNQGSCTRAPWFDCSCCPTNLIRFIPYIPNLIYATQGDSTIYVNLFIGSKANIRLGSRQVRIEQETAYPWDGKVRLRIATGSPEAFTIKVRYPSWAGARRPLPTELYRYADTLAAGVPDGVDNGYLTATRTWRNGDTLLVDLPMPVRLVAASDSVADDRGLIAVERGPLVYCAEQADNPAFDHIRLRPALGFSTEKKPDMLGGIVELRNGSTVLVPYYAWSNRGVGKMKVFLPE